MSTLMEEVVRGLADGGYIARTRRHERGLFVTLGHQEWRGEWHLDITAQDLDAALSLIDGVERASPERTRTGRHENVGRLVGAIWADLHVYPPEWGPFRFEGFSLVPTQHPDER
ncbi:hypothetical protein [Mumia zhuanghuii]|uniref:hypothetical protein n=1 Tax=Mumia zhuanghuii TaxID=2585211 RepID=UPI003644841E